jgi:hypothetical protein
MAAQRIGSPTLLADATPVAGADSGTLNVKIALPIGLRLEKSKQHGFFAVSMKAGSNAEKKGKTMIGMRLVSVNGKEIDSKKTTKKELTAIIKASNEVCDLELEAHASGAEFVEAFNTAQAAKEIAKGGGKAITATLTPPLGLSIGGNKTTGIFVTKLKETGSAVDAGNIRVGMKISSINDTSCAGMDKAEVVKLMKEMAGPTKVDFVLDETGFAALNTATATKSAPPPQAKQVQHSESLYDNGEADADTSLYDNADGSDATSPEKRNNSDIATMSRLRLIKLLKEKNIDYSAIDSKDVEAVRALAFAVAGP